MSRGSRQTASSAGRLLFGQRRPPERQPPALSRRRLEQLCDQLGHGRGEETLALLRSHSHYDPDSEPLLRELAASFGRQLPDIPIGTINHLVRDIDSCLSQRRSCLAYRPLLGPLADLATSPQWQQHQLRSDLVTLMSKHPRSTITAKLRQELFEKTANNPDSSELLLGTVLRRDPHDQCGLGQEILAKATTPNPADWGDHRREALLAGYHQPLLQVLLDTTAANPRSLEGFSAAIVAPTSQPTIIDQLEQSFANWKSQQLTLQEQTPALVALGRRLGIEPSDEDRQVVADQLEQADAALKFDLMTVLGCKQLKHVADAWEDCLASRCAQHLVDNDRLDTLGRRLAQDDRDIARSYAKLKQPTAPALGQTIECDRIESALKQALSGGRPDAQRQMYPLAAHLDMAAFWRLLADDPA